MTKHNRSFLVKSLLPALLLAGVSAAAQSQEARWSDPNTWPNRKVPVAGDKVTIGRDKQVVLDVSPPALAGLSIDGKLTFSNDADLELTTEWIMLHGELAIGTEAAPHTRKATITLTDNVKDEDVMAGMGDRGIMMSGGTLNLHGNTTNAWTKLASTAKAGSASIDVLDASGWRVGDEIVLASTDFNPRQAERRTIAAVNGNKVTLDKPLEYMHFGKITFGVDERGEVGLLTRNIKIQASDDAAQSFFGGHIMAMPSSRMYIEGVELNRMGQNLTLARYPVHWHLVGDAKGQYIRNAAIHDTFNRCVTVHGTNELQVENNVTFNTVGHCFFMEDGIEHGNRFVKNLAIQTKCHTSKPCDPTNLGPFGAEPDNTNFKTAGQESKDVLIPSDNTVSSFWITNPDNTYVGNVAAGSDSTGFWLAFPMHPTGQFEGTEISKATWPRGTKVREFKGNVAHSNFDGFMMDRGPQPDGSFRTGGHLSTSNPADPNAPQVESHFEDFTAYKNRNGGMWSRGEMHVYKGLKMADNAIGYTHATGNSNRSGFTSKVLDSLFVGETENIGNPATDTEKAYGRSLPQPLLPDFPIRGYEFYDSRHELHNISFVNYADNATRKTGAISYLLFTSFGVSTHNAIQGAKFTNAKPVYFPAFQKENYKWSNDDYGNDSYKTAVMHDVDGSLTGVAGSYVLNTDPSDMVAVDKACQVKPTWNAAVCKGDYGRLNFSAAGAPGPAAGAGTGARAGGRRPMGTPPTQPPVILSRDGKEFSTNAATNVRAGMQIKVATERPAMRVSVSELDAGSWVIFQLEGFAKADSGTAQSSLDALRNASDTSYFKDNGSLWVKLVSTGDFLGTGPNKGPSGGATMEVSR
ncbi:MAG: G8 domain-containing protein [Nevskiaceae bacterium]|jgi:cell migration-inducing and hyaluronan-binding protein|nr:G8 domain-containing protein [Nevskiaceae bacterium]